MQSVAQPKFVTLTAVAVAAVLAGTFGTVHPAGQGAAGAPAAQGQGRQGGAAPAAPQGGAPGRQGGAAPAPQAAAPQQPGAAQLATQGGVRVATNFDNVEVTATRLAGSVYLAHGGGYNAAFSVGTDGIIVADALPEPLADKFIAAIRRVSPAPIRFIFNTHWHRESIGGNDKVGAAGEIVVAGNFAGQAASQASRAYIWAHENALARISHTEGTPQAIPVAFWPTDVFFSARRDTYFNGESVMMLHQPNAHTDGDSFVYFRRSDVIMTGDVYQNVTFPQILLQEGGSVQGTIGALATLIELMVPQDKQEGGTLAVPVRGRVADEADVVEYFDMLVVIRDRIADAIKRGQTLAQVKAARPALDYEGRYGATTGPWTTDMFIEAVYTSLRNPPAPSTTAQN